MSSSEELEPDPDSDPDPLEELNEDARLFFFALVTVLDFFAFFAAFTFLTIFFLVFFLAFLFLFHLFLTTSISIEFIKVGPVTLAILASVRPRGRRACRGEHDRCITIPTRGSNSTR